MDPVLLFHIHSTSTYAATALIITAIMCKLKALICLQGNFTKDSTLGCLQLTKSSERIELLMNPVSYGNVWVCPFLVVADRDKLAPSIIFTGNKLYILRTSFMLTDEKIGQNF